MTRDDDDDDDDDDDNNNNNNNNNNNTLAVSYNTIQFIMLSGTLLPQYGTSL